ncbi:MAG: histidine phosphatase family protein [Desulfobacterales bacterium]
MEKISDNDTTILFVVRHGETEWNLVGKQQGHLDSPLTGVGIRQAHALAEGLATKGIEVIYSSDLGRAMQTAEVIAARLQLPVTSDRRLRERHLGLMQGMTMVDFRDRNPDAFARFESGDDAYLLPGGESTRQIYERCVACCIELAAQHPGGKMLVVTHGGALSSLMRYALNVALSEPRHFSLFNAAINCFVVSGETWRLDTWGDISHLREITTLDDA